MLQCASLIVAVRLVDCCSAPWDLPRDQDSTWTPAKTPLSVPPPRPARPAKHFVTPAPTPTSQPRPGKRFSSTPVSAGRVGGGFSMLVVADSRSDETVHRGTSGSEGPSTSKSTTRCALPSRSRPVSPVWLQHKTFLSSSAATHAGGKRVLLGLRIKLPSAQWRPFPVI